MVSALLRRVPALLGRDKAAERADLALELARLVVRVDPAGDWGGRSGGGRLDEINVSQQQSVSHICVGHD